MAQRSPEWKFPSRYGCCQTNRSCSANFASQSTLQQAAGLVGGLAIAPSYSSPLRHGASCWDRRFPVVLLLMGIAVISLFWLPNTSFFSCFLQLPLDARLPLLFWLQKGFFSKWKVRFSAYTVGSDLQCDFFFPHYPLPRNSVALRATARMLGSELRVWKSSFRDSIVSNLFKDLIHISSLFLKLKPKNLLLPHSPILRMQQRGT